MHVMSGSRTLAVHACMAPTTESIARNSTSGVDALWVGLSKRGEHASGRPLSVCAVDC